VPTVEGKSPRRRAAEALEKFFADPAAPLDLERSAAGLPEWDAALLRELALGVLRWRSRLDADFLRFSKFPLERLRRFVREILEVAVYQIRYLRVPDRAAVHEAVEDARELAGEGAAKLVNGILRSLLRGPAPEFAREDARSLAAAFSHPELLVLRWLERFGKEKTSSVLSADNERGAVDLLVNMRRTSVAELAASLRAEGVETTETPLCARALTVRTGNPLHTAAFREGHFYAADIGSQVLPDLLPSGTALLDLAAAPGGKSFSALFSGRFERVFAIDVSGRRLKLFAENRKRLDVADVHLVTGNLEALPVTAHAFDRVLLDAPCSGTGILRKNPEIRYRVTREKIAELSRLQSRLLTAAAETVAPGGYLLYSTCSLEREENEDVVARFLSENRDFEPAAITPPPGLERFISGNLFRIFPDDGADGFTGQLLRRK
jgi:16S rRNA (cytosine967-C5)-methyltransferase